MQLRTSLGLGPPGSASRRRAGRLADAVGRLDQRLLVLCRTRGHTPGTRQAAQALGRFGEWGLGWAGIGLAGAALDPGRSPAWLAAAAAGPAAVGINYTVKLKVGRERPLLPDHPRLARAPSKLSFPSAHATSSFAAATAMTRISPAVGAPLQVLAIAVCAGRPFLGVHYPTDVLAGILLGRALGRHWPVPGVPGSRQEEVWTR